MQILTLSLPNTLSITKEVTLSEEQPASLLRADKIQRYIKIKYRKII